MAMFSASGRRGTLHLGKLFQQGFFTASVSASPQPSTISSMLAVRSIS